MRPLRLLWHQFRYDRRTFWRDPTAVFFTAALPILFLFLFVTIFGNERTPVGASGETIKTSTYYVPGLLALAIVSATTVNLSISLTASRERGFLKRIRATPLPPWVYLAARTATAVAVSGIVVVLLLAFGRIFYGVSVRSGSLPGLVLSVVVGTLACCPLGFALSGLIPTERAAPPVANAFALPLYFFSGIFIPLEQIPRAMRQVADVFPVKHLFEALLAAFRPDVAAPAISGTHLAVLGLWGVLGLALAARVFAWVPRQG